MPTRRHLLATGLALDAGPTILSLAARVQELAPGVRSSTRPGVGSVDFGLLFGPPPNMLELSAGAIASRSKGADQA